MTRCEFCNTPIPQKRLDAVPNARFCVDCQPTERFNESLVSRAIAEPGEQDGVRPPAFEPLRRYPHGAISVDHADFYGTGGGRLRSN